MNTLTWVGICFCVSQSAMFSGLNIAFFSVSKLRLKLESQKGDAKALKVARLRDDSNFLLTTILWGNVGINVLLTLLSRSVMAGVTAFIFSTFIITFLGEIMPQAFFSRHAMTTASLLSPLIRFYQVLLYPVAKPTAVILDKWLGAEGITFFQEKDLREVIKIHIDASETDIEKMEGRGALNFLDIDDLSVAEEGELVDPESIIELEFTEGIPLFPEIAGHPGDPFLKQVQLSRRKWVILSDREGEARYAVNADAFIRSALFDGPAFNPLAFCHRPIILRDTSSFLGEAISMLKVHPEHCEDDVIDNDIILLWGGEKRIITGSDVLGRLLRGIVSKEEVAFRKLKCEDT